MPEADVYYTTMPSPIGELVLVGDGEALTRLKMDAQRHGPPTGSSWRCDEGPFTEAKRQIEAYFVRERTTFDLLLALDGTPFQRRVWAVLQTIPYGCTVSYRDVAERIGNPKAVRAVGLANGRNPIAIVVPCHRVIGASGALTGYGGGLPRKRWLLQHEAPEQVRRERT